jgi:hypothetical protein
MTPALRAHTRDLVGTDPLLRHDDELTELLAQLLERAWRRRHPELPGVTLDEALENVAARNGKP